jgi:lipid-binding SYLF domain-containing protein
MKPILIALLALTPLMAQDKEPAERLQESAAVFSEIMAATDTTIPEDLLAKSHCIVIVPSLKTGAFIVGGKFGKGYISCRNASNVGWSAPGTVRIEGGSVGFQIGGSTTDLIMLVMTERGADKLLESKFTLGVEGSVAAGPVGRTATAQTDAQMKADILSWSRSQGLLPALLSKNTLRQDLDDNRALRQEIVNRKNRRSGWRRRRLRFVNLLNKHSAREIGAAALRPAISLNESLARRGSKFTGAASLKDEAPRGRNDRLVQRPRPLSRVLRQPA